MATLDLAGKTMEVDGDGFLTQPELWTEEIAALIAQLDGVGEMNEKALGGSSYYSSQF